MLELLDEIEQKRDHHHLIIQGAGDSSISSVWLPTCSPVLPAADRSARQSAACITVNTVCGVSPVSRSLQQGLRWMWQAADT